MAAYWLTFKPLGPSAPRGWPTDEMKRLVRAFEIDPAKAMEWWRISSHRTARIGDRVYLFKQGDDPRGIFGFGSIIAGPELRATPTDQEGQRYRVLVRFERLVDPTKGFILPLEGNEDIITQNLVKAGSSGNSVPAEVAEELDRRLTLSQPIVTPLLGCDQADDEPFDPESIHEERERARRAICIRRGQAKFRNALLEAYDKRCAVSGCNIVDVLEAAHIAPYMGPQTNHVTNGLLLRSDLHTLFDCELLSINPQTRCIVISSSLKDSLYRDLSEIPLSRPKNHSDTPSRKCLETHFQAFKALEKLRE